MHADSENRQNDRDSRKSLVEYSIALLQLEGSRDRATAVMRREEGRSRASNASHESWRACAIELARTRVDLLC